MFHPRPFSLPDTWNDPNLAAAVDLFRPLEPNTPPGPNANLERARQITLRRIGSPPTTEKPWPDEPDPPRIRKTTAVKVLEALGGSAADLEKCAAFAAKGYYGEALQEALWNLNRRLVVDWRFAPCEDVVAQLDRLCKSLPDLADLGLGLSGTPRGAGIEEPFEVSVTPTVGASTAYFSWPGAKVDSRDLVFALSACLPKTVVRWHDDSAG